jgi:hypothetical protein
VPNYNLSRGAVSLPAVASLALGLFASLPRSSSAAVSDFSATDQEYFFVDSGPYGMAGSTSVNGYVGTDEDTTYGYALQFNISSLPIGATITGAELGLQDTDHTGTSINLSGFDGNGTFTNSTVTSTTHIQSFTPADNNADFYNVTTFVQGLSAGAEAGFWLTDNSPSEVDRFSNTGDSNPPELQITYTVPEPAAASLIAASILFAMHRRNRPFPSN